MIVNKAYNMANMMNVPVLGLIENMSYYVCPNCNEKINIFGKSKIDETLPSSAFPFLQSFRLIRKLMFWLTKAE